MQGAFGIDIAGLSDLDPGIGAENLHIDRFMLEVGGFNGLMADFI